MRRAAAELIDRVRIERIERQGRLASGPAPRLAATRMATQDRDMAISVTRFRATCLAVIRQVESDGESVDIVRRGKVVARLAPPPRAGDRVRRPWARLRGSGVLRAEPEESVLDEKDFEASR